MHWQKAKWPLKGSPGWGCSNRSLSCKQCLQRLVSYSTEHYLLIPALVADCSSRHGRTIIVIGCCVWLLLIRSDRLLQWSTDFGVHHASSTPIPIKGAVSAQRLSLALEIFYISWPGESSPDNEEGRALGCKAFRRSPPLFHVFQEEAVRLKSSRSPVVKKRPAAPLKSAWCRKKSPVSEVCATCYRLTLKKDVRGEARHRRWGLQVHRASGYSRLLHASHRRSSTAASTRTSCPSEDLKKSDRVRAPHRPTEVNKRCRGKSPPFELPAIVSQWRRAAAGRQGIAVIPKIVAARSPHRRRSCPSAQEVRSGESAPPPRWSQQEMPGEVATAARLKIAVKERNTAPLKSRFCWQPLPNGPFKGHQLITKNSGCFFQRSVYCHVFKRLSRAQALHPLWRAFPHSLFHHIKKKQIN